MDSVKQFQWRIRYQSQKASDSGSRSAVVCAATGCLIWHHFLEISCYFAILWIELQGVVY